MIYHSEFIWILNFIPLVGAALLYFINRYYKKRDGLSIFVIGVLCGIGFSLEYVFLGTAILILLVCLYLSKSKLKDTSIFILGSILPNLPAIIFDLKHDFYHFKTLILYTSDIVRGDAVAGFTYYHYLQFWPLLMIFLGIAMYLVFLKNKFVAYLLLLAYLLININSGLVDFNKPTGMANGLTISDLKQSSKVISDSVNGKFNVITLQDFDTRGHVLRYYLNYVYDKKPQGVIEYGSVEEVYVLANIKYDFQNNNPWELNVFKPYNIERLSGIGDGYALFKLTK